MADTIYKVLYAIFTAYLYIYCISHMHYIVCVSRLRCVLLLVTLYGEGIYIIQRLWGIKKKAFHSEFLINPLTNCQSSRTIHFQTSLNILYERQEMKVLELQVYVFYAVCQYRFLMLCYHQLSFKKTLNIIFQVCLHGSNKIYFLSVQ